MDEPARPDGDRHLMDRVGHEEPAAVLEAAGGVAGARRAHGGGHAGQEQREPRTPGLGRAASAEADGQRGDRRQHAYAAREGEGRGERGEGRRAGRVGHAGDDEAEGGGLGGEE